MSDPVFTTESTIEDYQEFLGFWDVYLGIKDTCPHDMISADYIHSVTGEPAFSIFCLKCDKRRNSQEWDRLHS